MKRPLIVSVAIHSVLVALAIFGLPHIMDKPDITEAVPVEIMSNAQIAELTTTNKPPVKAPPKEDPKKEPPPPKKEEPPKPPPKTEAAPPPPDDVLKEPPKPDKPVEDKKGDLPKKEDKKKPEKKPVKKPEPKPKKEVKKEPEQDFDSLLKNLAADDPPQPETPQETKSDAKPEPSPDVSRFSDVLTTSEKDAMSSHYQPCWNVMAGASGADKLVVSIRFTVTPQNTLINPQILDQSRYSSDSVFRAAADSAIRATRAERCSTLPPFMTKYNGQTVVLNFDPSSLF